MPSVVGIACGGSGSDAGPAQAASRISQTECEVKDGLHRTVTFTDRYVWHSDVPGHEDNEMMRPCDMIVRSLSDSQRQFP